MMRKSLSREVAVAAICLLIAAFLITSMTGCMQLSGVRYVEGTNFAFGMTIPNTKLQLNVIDYVGGLRVSGDDKTSVSVKNEVKETSSWFGVVEINRSSSVTAYINPDDDRDDK